MSETHRLPVVTRPPPPRVPAAGLAARVAAELAADHRRPAAGQPLRPAQPQVPYGAPQLPGYGPIAPDHPQATTVLVLGILGLVVCRAASRRSPG